MVLQVGEEPALDLPVVNRWYRRALLSVSSVCIAALVVTGLPPQARAEDPPVDPPAPQVSAPVESDSVDFPSAMVQARATGERVEITAERSESSTTWANPDGTLTTTQYGAPVRFQDEEGDWQKYDTTLVEQPDGSVEPAAVPDGVVLSGEIDGSVTDPAAVAEVDAGEEATVAVAWDGSLAAPELSGSAATYAEAWPGIDLVVHATRDGFEQSFVITDREALLGYVDDGEADASPSDAGGGPVSDGGGDSSVVEGDDSEVDATQSPSDAVTWDVPLLVSEGLTPPAR